MFFLTQSTRRRCCRGLFLALGLGPTLAIGACALWLQGDDHRRATEAALAAASGMGIELGSVVHLRPGEIRLLNLCVVEPETKKPLAFVPQIELVWQASDALSVRAPRAEVDRVALRELAHWLEQHFAGRSTCAVNRVRLVIDRVDVGPIERSRNGEGGAAPRDRAVAGDEQTPRTARLVSFVARVDRLAEQEQLQCSAVVEGREHQGPAELIASRNRQLLPVATELLLNTHDTALPCALVDAFFSASERLGSQAQFAGSLRVLWEGEVPSVEFVGRLREIELERLFASTAPEALSGKGDLALEHCTLDQGRLARIEGSLVAGPGAVSGWLLDAWAEHLGASQRHASRPGDPARWAYRHLACEFRLDDRGLALRGFCPGETHRDGGAVFTDLTGAMLRQPPGLKPASALAALLAGPGAAPDGPDAAWFLARLPAPADAHWAQPRPSAERLR